ncbi:MAG: regulatory protein RecX [Desulfitobacteriaceae bacterium]|nr:regulatory protein RecX [Desulfitobacteriaceae bacterium]MDD4346941.1 regulatory protein RecX [Desulfitobacteriaceae bacterium]MDD4402314.1 regulatory protein RecX [Desulfitobacteriaceae bacterium]
MKSAMDIALNILARRPVTQYEMEKRLRDKKITPAEIADTISRLIDWGYINDRRFAAEYCQLYSVRHSKLRIRKDLLLRGLDKVLVDEVLEISYSNEQELKLCINLAKQILERERSKLAKQTTRNRTNKIPQDILLYNKAGAKLVRLGYPYEMITKVLSTLVNGKILA